MPMNGIFHLWAVIMLHVHLILLDFIILIIRTWPRFFSSDFSGRKVMYGIDTSLENDPPNQYSCDVAQHFVILLLHIPKRLFNLVHGTGSSCSCGDGLYSHFSKRLKHLESIETTTTAEVSQLLILTLDGADLSASSSCRSTFGMEPLLPITELGGPQTVCELWKRQKSLSEAGIESRSYSP
jgi:hypothetical protein